MLLTVFKIYSNIVDILDMKGRSSNSMDDGESCVDNSRFNIVINFINIIYNL